MFALSTEELKALGALITTGEIKQQPELWQETFDVVSKRSGEIGDFLERVVTSAGNKKVRVLFTGAGTSEYVGDTITAYLQTYGDREHFYFQTVGTTDIVACPSYYLHPDETLLLVSFARSGNSPESVAAVDLADKLVTNVFHLTITCARDGALANRSRGQANQLLLLMPERSNDAGFAMTGSFSCMLLSALLIFDHKHALNQKQNYVRVASHLAQDVIEREDEIKALFDFDFKRIVYLGSGSLKGIAREAQLKILELTAGQIVTAYDSSMGFRHGPKSFVDEETLVIGFVNNDNYTELYDMDILTEIQSDSIAIKTLAISQKEKTDFLGEQFVFKKEVLLPDAYLALPMIFVAQLIALLASIQVGNLPDTPSKTGQVNRVVKGVTIHPFES